MWLMSYFDYFNFADLILDCAQVSRVSSCIIYTKSETLFLQQFLVKEVTLTQ